MPTGDLVNLIRYYGSDRHAYQIAQPMSHHTQPVIATRLNLQTPYPGCSLFWRLMAPVEIDALSLESLFLERLR
jgi:hypothetical protein